MGRKSSRSRRAVNDEKSNTDTGGKLPTADEKSQCEGC